jgi:hypothetical protein
VVKKWGQHQFEGERRDKNTSLLFFSFSSEGGRNGAGRASSLALGRDPMSRDWESRILFGCGNFWGGFGAEVKSERVVKL